MKKKLLYTYRIALVLYILIRSFQLLDKAFNWYLNLYPPYTGLLLFGIVAVLLICSLVMDRRIGKTNQTSNHDVLSETDPRPDFSRETEEIVERYLSRWPYESECYDGTYTIWMANREGSIYIETASRWISAEVFLGGWTDLSYCENALEDLEQEFLKDMDAILDDQLVQISFFTDEDTLRDSFLCAPEEAEDLIRQKLPAYTKKPPLWSRFLRLLFLVPQEKPVKEIRIACASGKYNRIISL